jgi:hypothetical protein
VAFFSQATVYAQSIHIDHSLTADTKLFASLPGLPPSPVHVATGHSVRLDNPAGARAASARMSSYILLDDVSNPSFAYSVSSAMEELFGWRRQVTLSPGML